MYLKIYSKTHNQNTNKLLIMKYSNLPLNRMLHHWYRTISKVQWVCFPRSSHRRERCTRFNIATKCTLVFLLNIWNCLSAMKKQKKKTNVHHFLFFFLSFTSAAVDREKCLAVGKCLFGEEGVAQGEPFVLYRAMLRIQK